MKIALRLRRISHACPTRALLLPGHDTQALLDLCARLGGAPVEAAQKPLFKLLGVADEHKRHRLFDGGHAPGQLPDVIREILDWFDHYLGPVAPLPSH